jgi:hypothetical protein
MQTKTLYIISGVLLLTIGACVNTKKLTGAEILPREQSGKVIQDQHAGGNLTNTTINVVGDDVLLAGAAIGGLMAFGWWYAAHGRKIQSTAVSEIVKGIEMSKRTLKRELDSPPPVRGDEPDDAPVKCRVKDVLTWMKVSNNFHQTERTRAIVRKLRGKPKKETTDGETNEI